ncbi:MAG: hypothetical protein ACRCXT_16645 [Paraclostridium sp.]
MAHIIDFKNPVYPPTADTSYLFNGFSISSGRLTSKNTTADHNKIFYSRLKFTAQENGSVIVKGGVSTEDGVDLLSVHVTTSITQPSYSNSTDRIISTSGNKPSVNAISGTKTGIVSGTTYYIHIQYRKDSSVSSFSDKVYIDSIQLPVLLSNYRVNVSGVWKDSVANVNVSGVWKNAIPYINVSGVWKNTI